MGISPRITLSLSYQPDGVIGGMRSPIGWPPLRRIWREWISAELDGNRSALLPAPLMKAARHAGWDRSG